MDVFFILIVLKLGRNGLCMNNLFKFSMPKWHKLKSTTVIVDIIHTNSLQLFIYLCNEIR
jgi:hypothetical protein